METLIKDLRYASRSLLKRPAFVVVAVMTLALGIGANTAIFSVVNAVLVRQLPYEDPDRLFVLWERQQDIEQESPSYPNFLDWQSQNHSFAQMAIARRESVNLIGGGEPERLVARLISANFFSTLGVKPQVGRFLTPEEDRAGANPVVVISHGLWQRRFGGKPEAINKTLTVNDQHFTVIGVLPPDFQFYTPADVFASINLALPERLKQAREEHGGTVVVARLKPEVSKEQAAAELENIAINLERQYPKTNTTNRIFMRSIRADQTGNVRAPLLILVGAIGFVLLIACVNVANLLMARTADRRKEFALRAALGASQARLVRQLLTESLLLASVGGAFGLLLANWGKDLLAAGIISGLPWIKSIPLDRNVLLFVVVASLLTGVVFGLFPALQSAKPNLNDALKEGSKGAGGTRHPLRSSLVVAEVALALLLMVGAGLMLRSFVYLNRINTGFATNNLLTMSTMLSPTRYEEAAKVRSFYDELQRRIEPLPGVQAVAFSSSVPLQSANVTPVLLAGQSFNRYSEGYLSVNTSVSQDYFRLMGMTLLKGRTFTTHDTPQSASLYCVIDENMARDLFPGKDPLGQSILLNEGQLRAEIIGVVNHIRHLSYEADEQSNIKYQFYTYLGQIRDQFVGQIMRSLNVIVRTENDPMALVGPVRAQVAAIDPEQLVFNATTMDEIIATSIFQRRFLTFLLALFAAVAIALSVIGIYGVISYSVTQRTHEIGVRMALGADARKVKRLIIKQGMTLTVIGVALGLMGAFAMTRYLESLASMLYGVGPTDPLTFVLTAVGVLAVALMACLLPAHRATKVDPLVALRCE